MAGSEHPLKGNPIVDDWIRHVDGLLESRRRANPGSPEPDGISLSSPYEVIRPFMSDVPMRRPDPRKNL
jgi:hypothetical protein